MKDVLQESGKKVLRMSKPGAFVDKKETWRWPEEVEEVEEATRAKKQAYKRWRGSKEYGALKAYCEARTKAKEAVRLAKDKAFEKIYDDLYQNEGERQIFKIARARKRKTEDFGRVRFINDERGDMLTEDERIRERWRAYFEGLFNEENPYRELEGGMKNEEDVPEVERAEVAEAIRAIKRNRAPGPDDLQPEAWKYAGEDAVDLLQHCLTHRLRKVAYRGNGKPSPLCPFSSRRAAF